MIYRIRVVKTASGKKAVQVVHYGGGKTWVIKHIGSASNSEELIKLKRLAKEYINKFQPQQTFFPLERDSNNKMHLALIENLEIGKISHGFGLK